MTRKSSLSHSIVAFAVGLIAALAAAHASGEGEECGSPFVNGYGPFDYANSEAFKDKLPIVERYHFTPETYQEAISGTAPPNVIDDLDYTLRAFPNHPRALYAMGVYQEALRKQSLQGYAYWTGKFHTTDCYFRRATDFKPNDPAIYAAYGSYLYTTGQKTKALQYFKRAVELNPESPEYNYDVGLSLLESGDLEGARRYAEKAYEGGYPLSYLRDQLKRKGVVLDVKPKGAEQGASKQASREEGADG
jgi:tetratricopeptide (TPR) repeat protein